MQVAEHHRLPKVTIALCDCSSILTSKECLSLIMTGCTASSARMITFWMALKSSLVASAPDHTP